MHTTSLLIRGQISKGMLVVTTELKGLVGLFTQKGLTLENMGNLLRAQLWSLLGDGRHQSIVGTVSLIARFPGSWNQDIEMGIAPLPQQINHLKDFCFFRPQTWSLVALEVSGCKAKCFYLETKSQLH